MSPDPSRGNRLLVGSGRRAAGSAFFPRSFFCGLFLRRRFLFRDDSPPLAGVKGSAVLCGELLSDESLRVVPRDNHGRSLSKCGH